MKIIMAAGGTGGHIFPAIAVARALQSQGHDIHFIAKKDGMAARLVPEDNFTFHGVAAGKWHRGWDKILSLPKQFFDAWQGMQAAVGVCKKEQPDLVIGFGGFASLPGIYAARRLKIPYVLHEGNAYPGIVTRHFAKQAALVLVSRAEAKQHFTDVSRFAYVPFPIREIRMDKAEAREKLGIPQDVQMTLVMGGSQGSLKLNTLVPEAFQALEQVVYTRPHVLHATGKSWFEDMQAKTADLENYLCDGFVDAIAAWSAADMAICRSGISSLSEAAFYGVPTVMIPLASSANNHQVHNARSVEASGAGIVVEEKELLDGVAPLVKAWQQLLKPEVQEKARAACLNHSPEGASDLFINLLETIPNLNFHAQHVPVKDGGA